MIAHFTVKNIAGEILDTAATARVRTADLISRAFAAMYPGCEVEVEFKPA